MPDLRTSPIALAILWLGTTALFAQNQPADQSSQSPPDVAARRAGAVEIEEHWQSILIGDERIGYVRSRIEPIGEAGRLRTDTETKMTFKRFGQEITIGVAISTTETADGQLLGYEYAMRMPTGTMKSAGTVEGDELTIKSTVAGETATRTIPFDPTVKSPAYQDRLLREKKLEPGDSRTYRAFIPEMNQVTKITVTADEWQEVTLPDGSTQSLLKTTIAQSILPNLPMVAYLDQSGEIVLAEMEMLGQTMRMVAASKDDALAEIIGSELDLAVNSLIPASPLENPHETKRVVYKVHVPGENAASLFVDDGTQHVQTIDHETVKITVVSKPIPPNAAPGETKPEYTQPSQMVQSDDETVREHLAQATTPEQDPAEAARALEAYVHEVIKEKNFENAFASAGQVADSLEGDCSEHAVLLAALLRARGIPSRLVAGIVYVPGEAKMGGHMWTEAFLGGEWIPLDATLGRGGIGGGHLKIGVTSLSDEAPLPVTCFAPLLSLGSESTIEVLKAER